MIGPDIQGIVFDAVGTLIHPQPSVAEAYVAAARRHGVTLDPVEVKSRFLKHFGDDDADDEARGTWLTDEATEERRWRRIVAKVLPEVPDRQAVFADLWEHFARPESWRPDPDAASTFKLLRDAGLQIGIGSNFDGRLRGVLRGMPTLGIDGEPILISSEVGFRKPHPAFYEAACAGLCLRPGQILWVGDDLENDCHGPLRAGFQAVLVDRRGVEADPSIRCVKTLGEIRPETSMKRSEA